MGIKVIVEDFPYRARSMEHQIQLYAFKISRFEGIQASQTPPFDSMLERQARRYESALSLIIDAARLMPEQSPS